MAKVTSKFQVTLPRRIADQYRIRPGDEIDWVAAGEVIRVVPRSGQPASDDRQARLALFDEATKRQRGRRPSPQARQPRDRGWQREDLYSRGRAD